MNRQKQKQERIEMIAKMLIEYLCERVKSASDGEWFELYAAAYDFIDDPSFHCRELDQLCALDRRDHSQADSIE